MQAFSPREIVSELDRLIIGQDDAKKIPSRTVVLPALFFPRIMFMLLLGDSDMSLSERKLVAVNWLINNLNSHWHNNVFIES